MEEIQPANNRNDLGIQVPAVLHDGSTEVQAASASRSAVIDEYEGKLAKARWEALGLGTLQAVCRFLAYCNLTWATVVLLGGFVSSISPADFRIVTALLLLESGRLGSAVFFSRLVKKALIRLSQNPALVKLEDDQPTLLRKLRVLSQIGQAIFIFPSIVLPIIRLRVVRSDTPNLLVSLDIFYILALINAAVALAAVVCSIGVLIHLFDKMEQSVQMYYDEILQRTFDDGIVQADEFDFFDFAFKLLGKEFARNVQPPTVQKRHKQLLEYMNAHRQGVDFLQIYLDWDNAFVQQAAANVVGFWAVQKQPVNRLPKSLLTKLADKLGPGQVGWAAANSFDAIAKLYPRVVLESMDSNNTTVLATLMEMVEPSNTRSLVFVRVLISLVSISKDAMKGSTKLVAKLEAMLRGANIYRLRVLAGSLLFKLDNLNLDEASKSLIEAIDLTKDNYIYHSELYMLNELRAVVGLPLLEENTLIREARGKGKGNFEVRQDL